MESTYAFIFCNPTSGGNKAARLLELPCGSNAFDFEDKELGVKISVKVFNLKAKESKEEGFKDLRAARDEGKKIRAIAAGGDGTVKWVISELVKVACVEVPIGVIPFGTGNDMSRILGWGATAPSPLIGGDDMVALKAIVKDLAVGEPLALDVWKVETKCDPDHGRFDVAIKGEIVEREDKAKVVIDHMINYCSFGQDARAVFGFERHRRTTQFLNKVQFALEGGKLSLQAPRRLSGTSLNVDGDDVADVGKLQGLIFQNIPSYAAGSDFWDASSKWTPGDKLCPQMVGDKLLEVHALDKLLDIAMHKVTMGLSEATDKLAQGTELVVRFNPDKAVPMYMQVDGEPCRITAPVSCEIQPAFQVMMIHRNDAMARIMRSLKHEIGTATSHILFSSYLLKARKNSNKDTWNPRFVALVQREKGKLVTLEWYREKDLRHRVEIVKDGKVTSKIEKLDHGGKRPNTCFTLVNGKNTYHFAVKTEGERDAWLGAFEKAVGMWGSQINIKVPGQ